MSVCLLIMCIALCVTLSASSGSFPMFFPKTILPLCTSLPHVFGQQRQRQSNAMLFGETLQGVAKNVWAMCCTTPCLVCCLQCVPLLLCFFPYFCVCCSVLAAMCPISAETGQWSRKVTRWREDTCGYQPINGSLLDFFCKRASLYFCKSR